MVGEIIEGIVRGGEHLDPEPLEQCERPVGGLASLRPISSKIASAVSGSSGSSMPNTEESASSIQ